MLIARARYVFGFMNGGVSLDRYYCRAAFNGRRPNTSRLTSMHLSYLSPMNCGSLPAVCYATTPYELTLVVSLLLLLLPTLVSAVQDAPPPQQLSVHVGEDVREYCQLETFSPRCRHGDVIVMTTARFGRMRVGKCIDADAQSTLQLLSDPNSLGCYADVLDYADKTCSGRSACDIPVPTRELLATRPCFEQLTMYLEAAYTCMSVVEEDRSCTISVPTTVRLNIRPPRDDTTGQLQQQQPDTPGTRCGTPGHPWILEAQTGQQINIRLLDFVQQRRRRSRWTYEDDEQLYVDDGRFDAAGGDDDVAADRWPDAAGCVVRYGYIVDKSASTTVGSTNTTICAGSDAGPQRRERFVYQSKGSSVEIVLTGRQSEDNDRFTYLISFEAVGCGNLIPPVDTWLRRADNEATIGCFLTRKRWHLRCVDGQWRGIIGTCSDAPFGRSAQVVEFDSRLTKYQAVALGMICALGLASCVAIICVGVLCVRRIQQQACEAEEV